MKKIFIVYGVLVVLVVALLIWRFANFDFNVNLNPFALQATAMVNAQELQISVADSEEERIKGLSGKRSLGEDEGMLFIFEENGYHTFWMKDMNFPLDIIYLRDNTVVDVIKNAEPADENATNPPTYSPDQEANRVLEVNAGTVDRLSITEGMEINFENL